MFADLIANTWVRLYNFAMDKRSSFLVRKFFCRIEKFSERRDQVVRVQVGLVHDLDGYLRSEVNSAKRLSSSLTLRSGKLERLILVCLFG